jgi:hypothetical protein
MKLKHLFLALIIFITSETKIFSQESRFIEISAVDTIELKPLQFVYQINIQNNTSQFESDNTILRKVNSDTNLITQPSHKQNKSIVKQVINILEANQFHYTISDENNYAINGYNNMLVNGDKVNDTTILVSMNTESDLKKLYRLLVPIQNISSRIDHIEYESISFYQNDSYARLYLKAKTDAAFLAAISGNSIGQIISVDEDKNPLTDMFQEMTNAENSAFRLFPLESKNSLNKKIFRKLLFKFQLK